MGGVGWGVCVIEGGGGYSHLPFRQVRRSPARLGKVAMAPAAGHIANMRTHRHGTRARRTHTHARARMPPNPPTHTRTPPSRTCICIMLHRTSPPPTSYMSNAVAGSANINCGCGSPAACSDYHVRVRVRSVRVHATWVRARAHAQPLAASGHQLHTQPGAGHGPAALPCRDALCVRVCASASQPRGEGEAAPPPSNTVSPNRDQRWEPPPSPVGALTTGGVGTRRGLTQRPPPKGSAANAPPGRVGCVKGWSR